MRAGRPRCVDTGVVLSEALRELLLSALRADVREVSPLNMKGLSACFQVNARPSTAAGVYVALPVKSSLRSLTDVVKKTALKTQELSRRVCHR